MLAAIASVAPAVIDDLAVRVVRPGPRTAAGARRPPRAARGCRGRAGTGSARCAAPRRRRRASPAGRRCRGSPGPRLTAPVRTASADISAKMVVPNGRIRATRGSVVVVTTPSLGRGDRAGHGRVSCRWATCLRVSREERRTRGRSAVAAWVTVVAPEVRASAGASREAAVCQFLARDSSTRGAREPRFRASPLSERWVRLPTMCGIVGYAGRAPGAGASCSTGCGGWSTAATTRPASRSSATASC